MNLRFNNEVCKLLLFQSQDIEPLWFDVGMNMVKISSFLLNPRSINIMKHDIQNENALGLKHKSSNLSELNMSIPSEDAKQTQQFNFELEKRIPQSFPEIKTKEEKKGRESEEGKEIISKKEKEEEEELPFFGGKRFSAKKSKSLGLGGLKLNIEIPGESDEEPFQHHSGVGEEGRIGEEGIVESGEYDYEELKNIEEMEHDQEFNTLVWKVTLQLLQQILNVPDHLLNQLSKPLLEEVLKKTQDLNMQLMNFIVKTLLPYSSSRAKPLKAIRHQLISIIDRGCYNYYSEMNLNNHPTNTQNINHIVSSAGTLSQYCINNLFDLCEYYSDFAPSISESGSCGSLDINQLNRINSNENETQKDYTRNSLILKSEYSKEEKGMMFSDREITMDRVKYKIAKITTPVLINRCRATLLKFLSDEKRSGSMPLPKYI